MPKPSITIIHYTCPPIIGGVESVIAATAQLLADHHYPTQILAGRGQQFDQRIPVTIIPALDSKNATVLDINNELAQGNATPRFHSLAQDLAQALQQQLAQTDLAIVHNAFTLHFNLPLTAALHHLTSTLPTAFIAWCHDLAWTNPLYIPNMRDAWPWSLLKQHLSNLTYVAVSRQRQHELAALLAIDPANIHVVTNGVNPATFLNLSPLTLRLAAHHDLFAQDLVLLLPARITARKNIELAIHIVAALKRSGLKVKLIVTGPPGPHNTRSTDYLNLLLALRHEMHLTNEVAFLCLDDETPNGLPDSTISELFLISDALLFTSTQEGFGIPILEAALARLPIFCSHIPAFAEIAADHATFFSLNDDPATIAQQLIAFHQTNHAHRLRRHALKHFTWQSIFQESIEPLICKLAKTTTIL